MGKNKLKKFADMEAFSCVFQFPFSVMSDESCPMRGKWNSDYFHNDAPIVLELGCGKGEYTVGLARKVSISRAHACGRAQKWWSKRA